MGRPPDTNRRAGISPPLSLLRTRQVCNRDAPVHTGPFPSSVETANERDRRSVSAVSVYATYATDSQCLRDLIAASSPPGHVTVALWTPDRFHSLATIIVPSPYLVLTIWRYLPQYEYCTDTPLFFYGHFAVISRHFAISYCLLPHPYSFHAVSIPVLSSTERGEGTHAQWEAPPSFWDARQECQCRRLASTRPTRPTRPNALGGDFFRC